MCFLYVTSYQLETIVYFYKVIFLNYEEATTIKRNSCVQNQDTGYKRRYGTPVGEMEVSHHRHFNDKRKTPI